MGVVDAGEYRVSVLTFSGDSGVGPSGSSVGGYFPMMGGVVDADFRGYGITTVDGVGFDHLSVRGHKFIVESPVPIAVGVLSDRYGGGVWAVYAIAYLGVCTVGKCNLVSVGCVGDICYINVVLQRIDELLQCRDVGVGIVYCLFECCKACVEFVDFIPNVVIVVACSDSGGKNGCYKKSCENLDWFFHFVVIYW